MSAVIPFPAGRSRSPNLAEGSGRGEVIIFPGVRVERLDLDLAERLPASRRSSAAQSRSLDRDLY